MAFNKYTQEAPAQYDPRSFQETLYLPTLKRQQHDKLEEQAAVTKSQLDKFDSLDEYSDMANEEKERLRSQIESFSSNLATQGVNTSSKSKFLDIAGDFSKSTSESGKLFKIDNIKKKYLIDKEKVLADATAKGYNPEQSLKNLEEVYNAHFKNNNLEDLKFIDLPDSPEFYGVAEAVNQFKAQVGSTTFNEILNSGSYKVDENGVIQIDKSSITSSNNLKQLEAFRDLLNQNLTAEGSKGKASADWQNRPIEDITNEINSVINSMKDVKQINEEDRSFNFSLLSSKLYSSGPKKGEEKEDGLETVQSEDHQNTLGLKSYEDLTYRISNLKKDYEEAKKIPNNEERIEELTYKIREAETVEAELNYGVKNYDNLLTESSNDFFNKLDNHIQNENVSNSEIEFFSKYRDKLLEEDNNIPSENDIKITIKEDNDTNGNYIISAIPYKNDESTGITNIYGKTTTINRNILDEENAEKIYVPKALGESLLNSKKNIKTFKEKRKIEIDKIAKEYSFERKVETPLYKNSAEKTFTAEQTLQFLGKENSVQAENLIIRKKGGKASDSYKDNKSLEGVDVSSNVTNFISVNSKKLAPHSQIRLGQIGNKAGYVIDINIDDNIDIDDAYFSGDIEKGGSIEMFIPLDNKSIKNPSRAQGFFYHELNDYTKHVVKRNMDYANINPTVNEKDLGKNYEINGASLTKNKNDDFNIDFLTSFEENTKNNNLEKVITIEKINPQNPGESLGKMKWGDLYEHLGQNGITDYWSNINNEIIKEDFIDILLSKLSKEDYEKFNSLDENKADFLNEKFKEKTIKLNSKNELNIMLFITNN